MMRNGDNTWADAPKRDEYRRLNDGMGACNLRAGPRGHCILGGIGCDIDHIEIARANFRSAQITQETWLKAENIVITKSRP